MSSKAHVSPTCLGLKTLAFFNFNKDPVIQISNQAGYTAKKGATSLFVPGSHRILPLLPNSSETYSLWDPGPGASFRDPGTPGPPAIFLSPRRPQTPGPAPRLSRVDATPGPQEILLSPPPATPGAKSICNIPQECRGLPTTCRGQVLGGS